MVGKGGEAQRENTSTSGAVPRVVVEVKEEKAGMVGV